MRAKRSIAIGGVAASLLGGGAALAARSGDEGDKTEDAILSDAAKRLGVSADELENALAKAEDAQVDRAVEAGKLSKEQAEAIKRHRERSGRVLGFPGGPGPGFGFRHHFHGPKALFMGSGGPLEDVAEALGISAKELFSELRAGKTLSEVAKAHGKSIDELEKAVEDASEKRIDEAVKDGKLTEKQADEIREHLEFRLGELGKHALPDERGFHRRGFGPSDPPPPPWPDPDPRPKSD